MPGYLGDDIAENDIMHWCRLGFSFYWGELADGILSFYIDWLSVGEKEQFGRSGWRL